MGELYPLLIILFSVCWSCGEQNITTIDEQDNISTTVTLWARVYLIETTDTLNLNMNGLTGSIPPEIGNLTNLIYLNLSGNQFTGSIPSEIGNLTNLNELWLNINQLSGQIPESICDLDIDFGGMNDWGYEFFNIQENQLCPPYPSCIEDYVGNQDISNCP